MSKSGARFPEPLDTVLREMAGDFDIDRYSLECWIVAEFVLAAKPTWTTDTERLKIERMRARLAFTHEGLPTVVVGVQQALPLN